jgi:hypothetical protein
MEGVDAVSEYRWFPSYYQQPREPMIVIAADPDVPGTDSDYPVPPKELAAFRADPVGVMVPVKMMTGYARAVVVRHRAGRCHVRQLMYDDCRVQLGKESKLCFSAAEIMAWRNPP